MLSTWRMNVVVRPGKSPLCEVVHSRALNEVCRSRLSLADDPRCDDVDKCSLPHQELAVDDHGVVGGDTAATVGLVIAAHVVAPGTDAIAAGTKVAAATQGTASPLPADTCAAVTSSTVVTTIAEGEWHN